MGRSMSQYVKLIEVLCYGSCRFASVSSYDGSDDSMNDLTYRNTVFNIQTALSYLAIRTLTAAS